MSHTRPLKIISWNVNGVRSAHRKGLREILNQHKPDVFCLQEVKAQETDLVPVLRDFPDYVTFHSVAKARGYSGVSTWVHKDLEAQIGTVGREIGAAQYDQEGRFLSVHVHGFDIVNAYFPSGTSGDVRQEFKYRFLDHFHDVIKALPAAQRKRLVICGDFNICHKEIDIHHPKEAERRQLTGFLPDERKWMDGFVKSGFTDSFRHVHGDVIGKYTWWTYRANARPKNLGWRIDYIFISDALHSQIENAEILDHVSGSDHCPISVTLHSTNAAARSKKR